MSSVILVRMGERAGGGRRRGRPPATDSANTWRAILDNARRLFGERGYGAVTNKDVAAAAGITTGALYHYVDSKLDLYEAVDRDLRELIYERFLKAVAQGDTFVGKLTALLDEANAMIAEDPAAARFVGATRTDMLRHPEVAERLAPHVAARDRFFTDLVNLGVETGEISPDHRACVEEFVRTVLIGLTEYAAVSVTQQRSAIDGVKLLLSGSLIRPPG